MQLPSCDGTLAKKKGCKDTPQYNSTTASKPQFFCYCPRGDGPLFSIERSPPGSMEVFSLSLDVYFKDDSFITPLHHTLFMQLLDLLTLWQSLGGPNPDLTLWKMQDLPVMLICTVFCCVFSPCQVV